jgi:hypothetical protein
VHIPSPINEICCPLSKFFRNQVSIMFYSRGRQTKHLRGNAARLRLNHYLKFCFCVFIINTAERLKEF